MSNFDLSDLTKVFCRRTAFFGDVGVYNSPMTNPQQNPDITASRKEKFQQDGFLVLPGQIDSRDCEALRRVAEKHLRLGLAPIEYEVDVQYPGSPSSAQSAGGMTPRRLLHAYSRDVLFRQVAASAGITSVLESLFGSNDICLSQSHHNCVMTKHPGHSSATLWHQDNRYWQFAEPDLISVWLALGKETRHNGCLRVIPGTHRQSIEQRRLDEALFLRPELEENKRLIRQSQRVALEKGDLLFFHSRLFHAAGRNLTDSIKFSLVFTYHKASNQPVAGTRSARYPSPLLREAAG